MSSRTKIDSAAEGGDEEAEGPSEAAAASEAKARAFGVPLPPLSLLLLLLELALLLMLPHVALAAGEAAGAGAHLCAAPPWPPACGLTRAAGEALPDEAEAAEGGLGTPLLPVRILAARAAAEILFSSSLLLSSSMLSIMEPSLSSTCAEKPPAANVDLEEDEGGGGGGGGGGGAAAEAAATFALAAAAAAAPAATSFALVSAAAFAAAAAASASLALFSASAVAASAAEAAAAVSACDSFATAVAAEGSEAAFAPPVDDGREGATSTVVTVVDPKAQTSSTVAAPAGISTLRSLPCSHSCVVVFRVKKKIYISVCSAFLFSLSFAEQEQSLPSFALPLFQRLENQGREKRPPLTSSPSPWTTTSLKSSFSPDAEKSLSSQLQLSPSLHSRAGAALGSQEPSEGCSPTARRWEPKGRLWWTEMAMEVSGAEEAAEVEEARTRRDFLFISADRTRGGRDRGQ